MQATEVVGSYHDLRHVERSFRMSKSDLAARYIFTRPRKRSREAIDTHLTIVFTTVAVTRYLQDKSGVSLKKLVHLLIPKREVIM